MANSNTMRARRLARQSNKTGKRVDSAERRKANGKAPWHTYAACRGCGNSVLCKNMKSED